MDPCVTKIERLRIKNRDEVHSVCQIEVGRVGIVSNETRCDKVVLTYDLLNNDVNSS